MILIKVGDDLALQSDSYQGTTCLIALTPSPKGKALPGPRPGGNSEDARKADGEGTALKPPTLGKATPGPRPGRNSEDARKADGKGQRRSLPLWGRWPERPEEVLVGTGEQA